MRNAILHIILLLPFCSCSSEIDYSPLPEQDDSAVDYSTSANIGKSLGIFGGSFSVIEESDSCKTHWINKLHLTIENHGINGAGYSNQVQQNGVQTAIEWSYNSDPSYDIYLLWSPSNDFSKGLSEIGTLNDFTAEDSYDSTRLTTMLGGMNYCYQKILQKNPKAEILLFTTLPIFNKGKAGYDLHYDKGNGLRQYVDAQIEWAKKYDIPYLDLFRKSGFSVENYGIYYQKDAIHPNVEGYKHLRVMTTQFLAFPRE